MKYIMNGINYITGTIILIGKDLLYIDNEKNHEYNLLHIVTEDKHEYKVYFNDKTVIDSEFNVGDKVSLRVSNIFNDISDAISSDFPYPIFSGFYCTRMTILERRK